MTVPKYKKPAKTATGWPGKFRSDYPGWEKQAYPWKFQCQAPLCFYAIVAATEEKIDKRIEDHPCPWFGGGTTTLSWGVMSDSYLAPIWELMDKHMDAVYDETASSEARLANREVARGLAYSLSILMPPFFSTPGEIIIEAKVRYEHRKAGTEYETPGLGRLKWKQPLADSTLAFAQRSEYDPNAEPANKLTDEEKAKIKASKMFPTNMLAEAYGVSEAVIKWFQAH